VGIAADGRRVRHVNAVAAPRVLDAPAAAGGYPIHLGSGILDGLGSVWAERARGGAVLLVHDAALSELAGRAAASLTGAGMRVVMAPVSSGEASKSLTEVERLCRLAASSGMRRADSLVGLGGGMIGDLAGFVAASYQRGIDLVHVPTTLLAMVDSSIGGKTGVNLVEGKNYVGAIWQPRLVYMDVDVLGSLPQRELASGFAEVIKYAFLEGGELLDLVESWPELPGPTEPLIDLVARCVDHKLRVVAVDERESGLRASLNLGHTAGHGIEAATDYQRYAHGEAISLGLLVALALSADHAGLDPENRERAARVIRRHGLPEELHPDVDLDRVMDALGRDKKSDGASLNMVLISAPGEVILGADPPRDEVRRAIEELRP
jgi:3-dehydroquinate synthase